MCDVWGLAGQRQHSICRMRLLADVHISPRTVQFLNRIGHDVIPVQSVLPADAEDETIVLEAIELGRRRIWDSQASSCLLGNSNEKLRYSWAVDLDIAE